MEQNDMSKTCDCAKTSSQSEPGWQIGAYALCLFVAVMLASILAIKAAPSEQSAVYMGPFAGVVVALIGFGAPLFWHRATTIATDDPGCYYTGALHVDRQGRLTANPYPDARPLGANGVLRRSDGMLWFVTISQCQQNWIAARVRPVAVDRADWQPLVLCRSTACHER